MSALPPPARSAGRVFAWIVAALLALALLAAVWIGIRGALAYAHLRTVQPEASAAAASLAADPDAAGPAIARIADQADAARSLTSDPVWHAAQRVPWVGPQLAAFGTVAGAAADLFDSLTPLATAGGDLSIDALRPTGGRIDPAVLTPIAASARAAAVRADAASGALGAVDRGPLLGQVARAVDDADTLLGQVAASLDGLSRASQLLPTMLGQDGPRTYLVVVQNNAEWRSLGGIAGAGLLLRADGGILTLAGTVSSRDFSFSSPVTPLDGEVTAIFDTKPARYFQNVTQVPDFSVGAPAAREMYRLVSGAEVDGVITVDPIVLSYLLQSTGPVTLATGDQLTAENAVSLLLNEVYLRYADPADQDAFFAQAAGAVFQALADGRGSATGLVSAMSRGVQEHRVLVWSADPDEESVLAGGSIAGGLPSTDTRTARFGVYLNDGTGSKMSYYTKPSVSLRWGACTPGSARVPRELTLDVTLESTAPEDAASSLPAYITGGGASGTAPGMTEVIAYIYLPEGFEFIEGTGFTGHGFGGGMHEGRRVVTSTALLAPGASAQLEVTVRAVTTATAAEAVVTPTADAALDPVVMATCGVG